MDEEDDQQFKFGLSPFPLPPPFYKNFTTDNVKSLDKIKEDNDIADDSTTELPRELVNSLPPELQFLAPPEPPGEEAPFRTWGEERQLKKPPPTLDGLGYERLVPASLLPGPDEDVSVESAWTIDRAQYLQTLVRSILLKFMELLGVMSRNPVEEQWAPELTDISAMFANAHFLINQYRPHQARETLINIMEDQLERKRAEIEGVKRVKTKIEETLAGFGSVAPDVEDVMAIHAPKISTEDVKRREIQRQTWALLEEELG